MKKKCDDKYMYMNISITQLVTIQSPANNTAAHGLMPY